MRFRMLISSFVAALAAVTAVGVVDTPAQAATTRTWDRIAHCESGGRWHINTGNGYYGGLQFSSRAWRAYGGRKYGGQAHKASKSEQITIARRVLAGQGAGAWGGCGRKAGLTKSSGKASRSAKPGSSSSSKKLTAKQKKAKAAKITKLKATKVATVTKKTHTLKKLAKRYHVKGGWKAIYELNKGTVKKGAKKHLKHGLRIQLRT